MVATTEKQGDLILMTKIITKHSLLHWILVKTNLPIVH
jgi:hypothetical protein